VGNEAWKDWETGLERFLGEDAGLLLEILCFRPTAIRFPPMPRIVDAHLWCQCPSGEVL